MQKSSPAMANTVLKEEHSYNHNFWHNLVLRQAMNRLKFSIHTHTVPRILLHSLMFVTMHFPMRKLKIGRKMTLDTLKRTYMSLCFDCKSYGSLARTRHNRLPF